MNTTYTVSGNWVIAHTSGITGKDEWPKNIDSPAFRQTYEKMVATRSAATRKTCENKLRKMGWK